ncbi:lactose-specific PTS transporter subunit EIIC [uncultured Anaerococcus sp.]|uniref:lactose-specific PTS transporter subunit EIIC n=1 Tax=uncultured Anaerococcus sp. TaxID=293428 RepID=UPI0028057447|nr:lactose-specific PTS transporter subunit EIIC [uncultured Anaerococcus sp.]
MNKLVERIEKLKPFFEKLSRNIYLRSIRDGFIAGMPVVLFSSIFILIAFVPNAFGIAWSDKTVEMLMKPYNYSMGILGFLVAGTTAKSFTDMVNRTMDKTKQINFMSTMLAAMIGFLILSANPAAEGGFLSGFMGTKGLITAFIAAFVTVNIYKVCMRNDVTIKMPKEVPPNISRVFTDLIPFSLAIVLLYGVDILVRNMSGNSVAESISLGLAPLFQAADGYLGLTLIFGAYAFFWFIGIHGPSIVEPAIAAVLYSNAEINLGLMQAGQHADKIITAGTQMFIVTMGGTGATLVVPFIFMLLAKSKRNKVVGRASVVPTFFGVNEPILFGAPIVLNPIFFVPFILAPIVNVWIFKFFVDILGMNSFTANLPWTTPAPIGMLLGLNFQVKAIILIFVLLIVDTIIYYPFFKVYDEEILEQELSGKTDESNELQEKVRANFNTEKADKILAENIKEETPEKASAADDKPINVLVLCAGGGTSGLLANALNEAAKEYGANVTAMAESYGAHRDILPDFDLVILAPQVASNYDDMKQETDPLGIKLVKTQGAQYIGLSRDGQASLDFVRESMK